MLRVSFVDRSTVSAAKSMCPVVGEETSSYGVSTRLWRWTRRRGKRGGVEDDVGTVQDGARSEKKRVVGTSGRFKRAPIVGGGGGLALDDAPWPNSSAALKPSTSSMVMPESGLARLFVMKSEARDGERPRDGGSGARRASRSCEKAPQQF